MRDDMVMASDHGMGTSGHLHGGLGLRYNQVVSDIAPTCQIVPLESRT